jgi:hypothetical protein
MRTPIKAVRRFAVRDRKERRTRKRERDFNGLRMARKPFFNFLIPFRFV